MATTDVLKKLRLYKTRPDLVQEMTPNEIADIAILVMNQVGVIEKAIKDGRLDGYTPQPDKDYLSKQSAVKMLTEAVNQMIAQYDSTVTQKSSAMESQVEAALQRIRDGKDGIVSEDEIQRAAEIAASLIELPDFDALITTEITRNGEAVRDALDLLPEDQRYIVEMTEVNGLTDTLNRLAQLRSNGSGGIGKGQVFNFIREAVDDGTIPVGSGVSDGDKGDIIVSDSGATWTIDNDTIGLDELSATGAPDNTKFLRGDNTWAIPPGSSGGITRLVFSINTPTTAGATAVTDYVYFVTNTTLTLPTAVGNSNKYTVKCVSGTCVVDGHNSETIDGTATITFNAQSSVDLISDGTNFSVV